MQQTQAHPLRYKTFRTLIIAKYPGTSGAIGSFMTDEKPDDKEITEQIKSRSSRDQFTVQIQKLNADGRYEKLEERDVRV